MAASNAPYRPAAIIAGFFYAAPLAFVVFSPIPIDDFVRGLSRTIQAWVVTSTPIPSFDHRDLQVIANIILFVPVGMLVLFFIGARQWWAAILIACLLSTTIELVQYALLPHRFATVGDIVSNTMGATIGVGAAVVITHLDGRRLSRRREKSAVRAGDVDEGLLELLGFGQPV